MARNMDTKNPATSIPATPAASAASTSSGSPTRPFGSASFLAFITSRSVAAIARTGHQHAVDQRQESRCGAKPSQIGMPAATAIQKTPDADEKQAQHEFAPQDAVCTT